MSRRAPQCYGWQCRLQGNQQGGQQNNAWSIEQAKRALVDNAKGKAMKQKVNNNMIEYLGKGCLRTWEKGFTFLTGVNMHQKLLLSVLHFLKDETLFFPKKYILLWLQSSDLFYGNHNFH